MRDARSIVRRLCLLLGLALAGLVLTGKAFASFPATVPAGYCGVAPCYEYRYATNGAFPWRPNGLAACEDYKSWFNSSGFSSTVVSVTFDGNQTCNVVRTNGNGVVAIDRRSASPTPATCPANATQSGSSCTCNAPLWQENPSHNACVPAPTELEQECTANAGKSAGRWSVPGQLKTSVCHMETGAGGCTVTLGGTISLPDDAGQWMTYGAGTYTGEVCQGSADHAPNVTEGEVTPPTEAPAGTVNDCPNGTPGTVNGAQVCIRIPADQNVVSSEGSSSSTTNADGTSQTVTKSQAANCANGQCQVTTTTTTTTKDASGTVTSSGTSTTVTTAPKAQFCADNPGSAQCNLDGEDACDTSPSRLGCLETGTPSDGELPTQNVNIGTPGEYSMAGFNLADAPAAGASWEVGCPAPETFTVFGREYSLSFEAICRSAYWVRMVVWLAAALTALYIVYSALLGARK